LLAPYGPFRALVGLPPKPILSRRKAALNPASPYAAPGYAGLKTKNFKPALRAVFITAGERNIGKFVGAM